MTNEQDRDQHIMQRIHPMAFAGLMDALALIEQGKAKATIWLRSLPSRETCVSCSATGWVNADRCPACANLSMSEVLRIIGLGELSNLERR